MWSGKVTDELKKLASEYSEAFDGDLVDGYEEICYNAMSYEQFVGFIKKAIETGKPLTEIVP